MIRDTVRLTVTAAIARLKSSGALPTDLDVPVEIVDPRDPAHGDFACSWALAASKPAGKNPRELAELLKGELLDGDRSNPTDPSHTPIPLFSSIEVAGPGFLNLRLADGAWLEGVSWANARAAALAKPETTNVKPLRLNVEFVSVNPNGPITVGSGRGAAFGSTLCNVLEAAGHSVHREYYINDGTNSEQMRLFSESVQAICLGRPVPENGYKGDYVKEAAEDCWSRLLNLVKQIDSNPDADYWLRQRLDDKEYDFSTELQLTTLANVASFLAAEHIASTENEEFQESKRLIGNWIEQHQIDISANTLNRFASAIVDLTIIQILTQDLMVIRQRSVLREIGVYYDTWFSEQSLHDSGKVGEAIQKLKGSGAADERPVRRKLKLAKGGVVEDVEIEVQPVDEDDDSAVVEATNDERHMTNDRGNANPTLWLRSTKFADDMDRVLRRKDGRLTYISSDVAYHQDKFERGSKPDKDGKCERADRLITILGPDHHGYIGRLHAVLAATEVGDRTDPTDRSDSSDSQPPTANRLPLTDIEAKLYASPAERDACRAALAKAQSELEVLIFQIVRFVKEGKPAPMRKRDGNIYSLHDLVTEIGKDAAPDKSPEEQMVVGKDVARFFYLMRSHDTHMDFDIDLATKGTEENPVFYVQYAHARICSILEKASLLSPAPSSFSAGAEDEEGERLHPKEIVLIKKILDLPYEVARCAEDYGVHRLTTYAQELARTFHHFYDACRVIQPENPELQAQRLAICEATRHALRGTLQLLGISAPEKM